MKIIIAGAYSNAEFRTCHANKTRHMARHLFPFLANVPEILRIAAFSVPNKLACRLQWLAGWQISLPENQCCRKH